MITSAENARVREIMLLNRKGRERRRRDVFLAEGPKMFLEAPRDRILETYVSESFLRTEEHRKMLREVACEVVSDAVFARMSDTMTPQGILTVIRQFHYTADDLLGRRRAPLLLILEDLQDPGNVGTIFRTAEGAGADGIFMTRHCVDIYHPKTIRATMGSIYRVPFLCAEDAGAIFGMLDGRKIRTYAAYLDGSRIYDGEDYTGGTAFLIGNEGNGLTASAAARADARVRIPMGGKLESLNAGVAAAILMYEAGRQRRRAQGGA